MNRLFGWCIPTGRIYGVVNAQPELFIRSRLVLRILQIGGALADLITVKVIIICIGVANGCVDVRVRGYVYKCILKQYRMLKLK